MELCFERLSGRRNARPRKAQSCDEYISSARSSVLHKRTNKMHFCMFLFYNLCTLHVLKDHFVHHQESTSYGICRFAQTTQTCPTARYHCWKFQLWERAVRHVCMVYRELQNSKFMSSCWWKKQSFETCRVYINCRINTYKSASCWSVNVTDYDARYRQCKRSSDLFNDATDSIEMRQIFAV